MEAVVGGGGGGRRRRGQWEFIVYFVGFCVCGGGVLMFMDGGSPMTRDRPSHPYNGGTEHVGF